MTNSIMEYAVHAVAAAGKPKNTLTTKSGISAV
jgi:hypothetical protein